MTSADQRSVGELLLEADLTARNTLMDVQEMDAATMMRTWGEVVQAASELWQSLPAATAPQPGTGQRPPDFADLTMQRLQAMTDSQHRRAHARTWPGQGPADERHLQIATTFARAEDLISRHSNRQTPQTTLELRDLNAARTRIMHTLYIGSHGVDVAVSRHLRDLEARMATRRGRLPLAELLRQTRTAHQHLTAFEQLAGAVVSLTYPGTLTGEHREPPAADRLAQAIAGWDVVSQRVLVSSTRTADLMLAARTQALVLAGSNTLLRAAAQAGHLDPTQHDARIGPAIEAAQEQWETLAGMWDSLTADRRAHVALASASLEARAALRELLHDAAGLAGPPVIAQRTDLSRVPGLVRLALTANLDLARVTHDAARDPALVGAARGVNTMAIDLRRTHPPRAHTLSDTSPAAWVDPRDLLGNRAVSLPDHARAELVGTAGMLVDAYGAAIEAGMQLEYSTPKTAHYGETGPSRGRLTQDLTLGTRSNDQHSYGCER